MKHPTLALALAGLLLGCSEATTPKTGSLAIVVATDGFDADTDGYAVRIDDSAVASVAPKDSILQTGLTVGLHDVELVGFAPNCVTPNANPRSVRIDPDTITVEQFAVTCIATRAGIHVRFAPTGAARDSNGHVVVLDDTLLVGLGFNADTSLRVEPGVHQLRLTDVAPFCVPPDDSVRVDTLSVGDIWDVTWSVHCLRPLSGRIAYTSQGFISTIRTDGMDARRWSAPPCYCTGAAISRDGMRFAWWGQGIVWNYADSTGFTRLTASVEALDAPPAWSPDGRRLAYISRMNGSIDTLEIFVVNADGSGRRQITHDSTFIIGVSWSPDGGKIAYSGKGDPRTFLYQVWVINPDGSGKFALTSDPVHHVEPAWSPDGSQLAYAAPTSTGNYEIWIMNADGSAAHPITTIGGRQPAWSTDGTRIAFSSARDGLWEIYVMNADGTGVVKLIANTHPGTDDAYPFWSP